MTEGSGGPFTVALKEGDNLVAIRQNSSGINYFGNLCAGSYAVHVINSLGCEITLMSNIINCNTITIPDPIIHQPSSCTSADGFFYFRTEGPSGGVSPYTYEWSNGDDDGYNTGLIGGVYTLTVTDANGCSAVRSFELENGDIEIYAGTTPTCEGLSIGKIYLFTVPTTLEEDLTIQWSSGQQDIDELTDLAAGAYSVTVTNNTTGCSKVETFTRLVSI